MNRFQKVSFRNLGEFMEFISPEESELVETLRALIMENMPGCREKLAYNVPFYYGNSRVVFLWPGSVPWGGVREPGVQLGFCSGHQLPSRELLQAGTRKEVFTLHFTQKADIDVDMVKMLFQEAWEWDQSFGKAKRRS